MNQQILYDLLFRSASETLSELAQNPKHLGAKVGMIGILHTWGQNFLDHPTSVALSPGAACLRTAAAGYPAAKGFSFP
jgi:hypothetical protein